MYRPETMSAARGITPKPGYAQLGETIHGWPANQETIVTWMSYWWDGVFDVLGNGEGYVAPTTQELQRLYDAATGQNGDPEAINPAVFLSLAYDLYFETPTDPRWGPFLEMRELLAEGAVHPQTKTIVDTLKAASRGEDVKFNYIEMQIESGDVSKEVLDQLPSGGKLDGGSATPSPAPISLADSVIELYIAYFNRAPEAEGLNYWSGRLTDMLGQGIEQGAALDQIADEFWPASVHYGAITGYSESMSNFDFVSTIYANVLGRPDAVQNDMEGINYWINQFESGAIASKGQLVNSIIKGAYHYIETKPNDAISIKVGAYLDNRVEVGRFFAQEQYSAGLTEDAATYAGYNVLRGVTDDPSSVTEAIQKIASGNFSTTQLEGQASARTMSLDSLYEGDTLEFSTVQFNVVNDMDFNVLLEQGTAGQQPAALEVFDTPTELEVFDTPTELGVVGVNTYTDYDMFFA